MVHVGHPEDCVICMDLLEGHVCQLDCKHVFHWHCVKHVFVSVNSAKPVVMVETEVWEGITELVEDRQPNVGKCPICRTEIDESKVKRWQMYDNRKKRKTTEGMSEQEKKEFEKRKKRNQKRMARRLKKESSD